MQELGLSQDNLARLLGLSRGAIGHYLAGRRRPDLQQMERLAEALQVEPAWLLFEPEVAGVQDQPGSYGSPEGSVRIPVAGTTLTGPGRPGMMPLDLPARLTGCYALQVVDESHAPRLRKDEMVAVSAEREALPGTDVVLGMLNGEVELLRLISRQGGVYRFTGLNGGDTVREIDRAQVVYLHPIIAVLFRDGFST